MHRCARIAAVAVLLWTAAPALAAPRLSVGPVAGDRAAAIPTQLARALCVRFECVLWPKVSRAGRIDPNKASAAGVAGVLTGALERQDGVTWVRLALWGGAPAAQRAWRYRLTAGGQLAAADLRQLEVALLDGLGARPAAPPAAPAPKPVPAPAPQPLPAPAPPAETARPAAPARPQAAPTAAPPRSPPAPPPAAAAPAEAGRPPLLAAEVGTFLARRSLGYGGTGSSSGTLLGFDATAIAGASLRVELFPLARGRGALAGLGLFGAVDHALGLRTESPGGAKLDTTFQRLQVGACWRSPPLTGARLVLVPAVAWRRYRLAVSPAIAGLPDADLGGVAAGLAAELPVLGRLTALAGVRYVAWTSARELVGGTPPYFPGGSAAALEGELGVDVRIWGPASARLVVEYGSTRYALDADPSGTYAATSATDEVGSARLLLRAAY